MLEPSIRQIAIQAIASRVSGTPAEAAGQILKGIAALDRPERPFVMWPEDSSRMPVFSSEEQASWLESQAAEIRRSACETAAYWEAKSQSLSPSENQDPSELEHKHPLAPEGVILHEVPGVSVQSKGMRPDQDASDES